MSTNKTTNYQLNQWEAEDKVLRTEFNEDNLKIDQALQGKADTATTDSLAARLTEIEGKLFYTKLLDYISSKSGSRIDLDVSDLDLTKYDSLEIRLDPVLGASYTTEFYLQVNKLTSGYWYSQNEAGRLASITLSNDPQELIEACFYIHLGQCLCGSSDYTYVRHQGYPTPQFSGQHHDMYFLLELPAAQVTSLNIVGQGNITTIPSGTRVRVYGWKK